MVNLLLKYIFHSGLRKALVFISLALIISGPATSSVIAQQTLADGDWFERELGDGVTWRFYLFDNLFSSMQSVSYIEVDLTNPNVLVEFPYLQDDRQKTSTMTPSQFPSSVAGINGTYFATSGSGGHVTYLRVDGTEIPPGGSLFASWGYEGALALDASSNVTMEEIPSGGWSNDTTHPDIMACGPLVIIGGVIPSADLTAIGSHCTSRHPRSAVGITSDSRLILLTVDGRTDLASGMTCEEIGQVMLELGCQDALNLDGGGSTTLWGTGELFNGVLNYPSDNGEYDHGGERSCSNAIAITSTAVLPKTWDARMTSKVFSGSMDSNTQQTVTLVYENIGTGTWTAADTMVVLARPDTRTSDFYHASSWTSPSQPAVMTPATVAPGATASFTFTMQAPDAMTTAVYDEHFMLTRAGVGRIGPADSEAWMRITVQPPVAPEETFIVESREGGQNFGWYSDSGMANSGTNCTASGCTGDIGTRYGSTYRSVAGNKQAISSPDFPGTAYYSVYVAWGDGSSRRNPVTYHVNHAGGTDTYQLDQTATSNAWVRLGTKAFLFEEGYNGSVVMTNEDIDVSGSMYAGAVMFEYLDSAQPEKTYSVNYLTPSDTAPVIDGQKAAGEWDTSSIAGTGFVLHDNPSASATEDGSFQMLFDDLYLYILFQVNDAYLPGYTTPPNPYEYSDLTGDKVNFFFTPSGVYGESFYRIMFCPNPGDGACYVWSQANVVKTTDAAVGADWEAGGEAAYNYTGGTLTIEYRIPWIQFDYPGIDVAACPEDGEIWGVQPCISNEVTAGNWEYVNWEPDGTPTYIFGEPFGVLKFEMGSSAVKDWSLY